MTSLAPVLIGCSGYSYPEWIGPFYAEGTPRSRLLERYAERFDLLEINYTYYRMPTAASLGGMVERTEGGVQFAVKLNGALTHERGRDEAAARAFVEAVAPMREADVLGALLAQFPQSFHADADGARYVNWLQRQLPGLPLVVEFRNGGWAQRRVFDWLQRRGIGLCNVDQPRLAGLFPSTAAATTKLGYVRFHGRNARQWHRADDPGDRYAYRYDETELLPWVERIRELAGRVTRLFVLFNNHRDGFAPANAEQFSALLRRAGVLS